MTAAGDEQGHPQRSHRLIVLIPTHLDQLDEDLAMVLRHNATELAGYALEIILPETSSPAWYQRFFSEHGISGTVRTVSGKYFGSPAAVNRMGTDPAFYRMYAEFEFILICHLDAWIFKDRLVFWMDSGYDFVGAPLFLPQTDRTHFSRRMAPFGANGGLSLRRVSSCIRVLDTFKPGVSPLFCVRAIAFLVRNRRWGFVIILLRLLRELSRDWRATCEKYNIYEDVFFTIIAPICGNRISFPSRWNSARFACEVNYALLQKEYLGLQPPVGVHGFDKHIDREYFNYARRFFSRKQTFYDDQPRLVQPLVSVVMIVKDLIDSGRMETFHQAIASVLNQTYERLEIILLDGASMDGTFAELKKRYGHVNKVALHRKADRSVWEGMQNAIELAKGELIAVMNSDDYFNTSNAITLMVERMIATDADMAYGHALLLTDQGVKRFPTHLPSVLNCFGILHQATLVKTAVIKTIDPFRSGHVTAENYLFTATLMAGFSIVEVPKVLVHYRVGGLSTELYGGANAERAISDYVSYMKKLTSIGTYLEDCEIRQLYGFHGVAKFGPVRFIRMILKVKDRRLRSLLLASLRYQLTLHGIAKMKRLILMIWRKDLRGQR